MKWHGWLGLAVLIAGEILLALGNPVVAAWFTPIMWTGYILTADAVAAARSGVSRILGRPREFGWLVVLSVLSWLIFEVYNLKLRNWAYLGVPDNLRVRETGFFWAFATITPAIFVTADVLRAFGILDRRFGRPRRIRPVTLGLLFVLGLALLVVPPGLPDRWAPYSFGAVWLGFIFFLEPINYRIGLPSFLRDWEVGRHSRIFRFLLAGLICGLLWEAWNYQAFLKSGGIWVYTIPQELRLFNLHYGHMPVLGMLGFPPFALECFAIFHFLRWALRGDVLLEPLKD